LLACRSVIGVIGGLRALDLFLGIDDRLAIERAIS
jgi:hypothetical protein